MVLLVLAHKRQEAKDKWEEGNILDLEQSRQMLLNAAAIGECQAYKFVMEIATDLDKLKGELDSVEAELR